MQQHTFRARFNGYWVEEFDSSGIEAPDGSGCRRNCPAKLLKPTRSEYPWTKTCWDVGVNNLRLHFAWLDTRTLRAGRCKVMILKV